jgi:hypothetical protein
MTGGDVLPWALGVLDQAGDLRARFVRLQAWAEALLVAPTTTKK